MKITVANALDGVPAKRAMDGVRSDFRFTGWDQIRFFGLRDWGRNGATFGKGTNLVEMSKPLRVEYPIAIHLIGGGTARQPILPVDVDRRRHGNQLVSTAGRFDWEGKSVRAV